MLYLILAILSSMLVTVVMRLSENRSRNGMTKLAVNYVMCAALSLAFSGRLTLFPHHEGLPLTLLLGGLTGVLYLAGFVLLQWNIHRNGVVLPATFMKLGVIVPTLLSIIAFGEQPGLGQLIGLGLALVAIVLIQGGSKAETGSLAGLLILLLCGGSSDGMSKIFEELGAPALKDQFLLYTFGTALILCTVLCVVKKQRFTWQDALWGLALGIPNYFSARFLLLSLGSVPAVVAYPTFSVGTIVAVTAVGMLCFRERLTPRKWISLGVILTALILLNI